MVKSLLQNNLILPLTLLAFSITYAGATDIINREDIIGLILYLFIICSIEYHIICRVFANSNNLKQLFLALAIFFNIHMVTLDFIPEFSELKFIYEISIAIFLTLLFFFFSKINDESKNSKYINSSLSIVSLSYILYILISLGTPPLYNVDHKEDFRKEVENKVFSNYHAEQETIVFDDKPDIIIFSYEALVSEAKYRSQTKRLSQLPVHELIERNLKSYKNHFTDELSTLFSISSLFALTPEYYHSLPFDKSIHRELSPRFGMVSGKTPSPFLKILKSNGYELSTFTEIISVFGQNQGPYIDNYDIPPLSLAYSSDVCKMLGVRSGQSVFLGYCNVRESLNYISSYIGNIIEDDPELVWTNEFGTEDMNRYLYFGVGQAYNQMKELIARSDKSNGKPQFLYAHINWPDDAAHGYSSNWRNKSDGTFRNFVLHYEKKARISAFLLDKTIELFKNRKKNTIIYIFGDHGMSLSTNLGWDKKTFVDQKFSWTEDGDFILGDEVFDINRLIRDDPQRTMREFDVATIDETISYVRNAEPYRTIDKYGSYGGLYSDHKCSDISMKKNSIRKYVTPQLVLHDIISCLATPESIKSSNYIKNFTRESTLRSQSWHQDYDIMTEKDFVKNAEPRKYLEYLYE